MPPKSNQNHSENKPIRKDHIYSEFITWHSIPPLQRFHTGIADQNEFAKHYHVSKDTLSLWKKRPDFEAKVRKIRDHWAQDKTADVFDAIYRGAVKGKAASQKIWMKYFWHEPKEPTGRVLHVDDIRSLITCLPEALQDKYNIFLRDLTDDIRAYEDDRQEDLGKSVLIYKEEKLVIEKFRQTAHPEDEGFYL